MPPRYIIDCMNLLIPCLRNLLHLSNSPSFLLKSILLVCVEKFVNFFKTQNVFIALFDVHKLMTGLLNYNVQY
jgi:hypothetical protein